MLIPFASLFHKYNIQTPGVLHLGANTGQEAQAYHDLGITQVIWVEAIPTIFEQLKRNVAIYPDNLCLLACVSNVEGDVVEFNVASNGGQSSSFLEFGTHQQEHPTVRYVNKIKMATSCMNQLLLSNGFSSLKDWFLNVDLQGAELLALKGLDLFLRDIKYIYIEVNERELYKGCPLVAEVDRYLADYGFEPKEVKMTGNGWGDKLYIRKC